VTRKAYVVPFGYQSFPKFTSARIDFRDALFSPVYGWDYTAFQLAG
jgi:hypothetical protein